jgi:fucose permease
MKTNILIVALIFLIFFVISFLTNILGPIIPDIIDSFKLSLGLAGFLPFSFFVAYGVTSIPAGVLIEKYSEKVIICCAFLLAFIGAMLFALFPGFAIALISLFLIGIGMAMLQVAINPLLRQAGGEAHFAFNSVMAQLVFGAASFLSPQMYSYLVANVHTGKSSSLLSILNYLVPAKLEWVSVYWIFAIVALLMVLIIRLIRFPKLILKDDEKIETGIAFRELMKNKTVILFFIGIFAYVSTEQGIANWTSKFLQTYHNINPATTGANVISYFWGLLTVGCILGLVLLKLFDCRTVLITFTCGAIISLTFALFGNAEIAVYAFPATGFFASVMWSVIFSLALNSVASHHGTFSGILCTGIIGGAIGPLIIGGLGDLIGLRFGMIFLYVTLGYIFSIGFWARPLINNSTILKKKNSNE